jgi:hypothetical protein
MALRKTYSSEYQLLGNYKDKMEDLNLNPVDINKLSEEEFKKLEAELSDKIIKIINKANEDANQILSKYGLETQMVMEIKQKQ